MCEIYCMLIKIKNCTQSVCDKLMITAIAKMFLDENDFLVM